MRSNNRNPWVLVLLILFGIIIGGIIGDLLGDQIQFLDKSYAIGLQEPIHLDLNVIELTFGLMFNINIASVIGFILSLVIFRKI